MDKIYIIEMFRDYRQHVKTEVFDKFFGSEEEAKQFLLKKYAPWLDEEHLYIYYSGLWRFRISDETGISFYIKPLKAA